MSESQIGFIFDWDGVVVDSSKQHEESWDLLSGAEGLSLFEGHFKAGFGKRNELIIRELLKWSEDESEIARLGDLKEVYYRKLVREHGLEPLPGVKDFVQSLVDTRTPYAVGSSTPRENIMAVKETAGIEGFFEQIFAAADVTRGKPHPEVFLKAAALINTPAERCVVFEDSFSGIEAGLAGGMKVVAIATTNTREALEEKDVALVVDSFEELSIARLQAFFE
ncbi:MAG: HAD family phosphatase [Verrucomicrobiota bacterium]